MNTVRTNAEIQAALEQATKNDQSLNGNIYPTDSLHAKGCKSPTCQWCVIRKFGLWLMGQADSPFITQAEQASNRARTLEFEYQEYSEAKVNNLYNLDRYSAQKG